MLSGAPASIHQAGGNEECKMLSEELSEQGYSTGAISGNPHITSSHFGDRFEWFFWKRRGRKYQYAVQRLFRRLFGAIGLKHIPANYFLADADYFTELATEFIKEKQEDDQPYFLHVHQMELHTPFVREERHLERFANQTEFSLTDRNWKKKFDRNIHRDYWYTDEIQNFGYDEIVNNIDRNLGRILDCLRSYDELDETIVIVTSDHGELLGERGLWGHLDIPYNTLFEIPLIIRDPDREPRQIENLVSGSQLPALTLDCLNLTPTDEMHEQMDNPITIDDVVTEPCIPALIDVFREKRGYNKYDPTKLLNIPVDEISSQRMLVSQNWKLHSINGNYYFYEYDDRFLSHPVEKKEVPDDIRLELVKEMDEVEQLLSGTTSSSDSDDLLKKEVREQLEDLGYR
jgi:arylsulfatase A-like enzyme